MDKTAPAIKPDYLLALERLPAWVWPLLSMILCSRMAAAFAALSGSLVSSGGPATCCTVAYPYQSVGVADPW